MTQKTVQFLRANAHSPVVYGSVTESGGCFYRLHNGATFELSRQQCHEIGHPRWQFEAVSA